MDFFLYFLFWSLQVSRSYENNRMLRRQLMEHHERALELETRRFSGMHLTGKPVNNQPFFGYSMDELKAAEGILLTSCPLISFISEWIYLFLQINSLCHPQTSSLICSMFWTVAPQVMTSSSIPTPISLTRTGMNLKYHSLVFVDIAMNVGFRL